jgi:general secretion pathway protein I
MMKVGFVKIKIAAPSCWKSTSGFTLLEMMVAISVIAIVLVSIYKMHCQTIVMNNSARFYTIAPLLAQNKLSEIETASAEKAADGSGDFGDKHPGYSWRVSVDEVECEPLGEIAKDLRKIDLTIMLDHDELTYSIRTYRFIRE